jgi:hypothetical protein
MGTSSLLLSVNIQSSFYKHNSKLNLRFPLFKKTGKPNVANKGGHWPMSPEYLCISEINRHFISLFKKNYTKFCKVR